MKKEILIIPPDSLRFGHLGNGIIVYTTAIESIQTRDYLTIAHICIDKTVKFYQTVDSETARKIKDFAKNENPSVSFTQTEQKVFHTL